MTQDERGATTVFVALMIGCLLAAAGIGIDTTSMTYQRSRVQHAADASAVAIARTCANGGACTAGAGQVIANDMISRNAPGGGTDQTPEVTFPAAGTVKVSLTRAVNTMFFGLLGIGSKTETASATATWGSYKSGNVKPFMVSLCEYTAAPTNTMTFLDGNSSDEIFGYGKNNPQKVLEDDHNLTSGCGTIPSGVNIAGLNSTTRMVVGGLWKNTNGDAGNGSVSNSKSTISIGQSDQNAFELGSAQTQNTAGYIDPGPVLFAIYAPVKNFRYGGAQTQADGVDPTSQFLENHPAFSFKIVGFAPFNVAAVRLGKTNDSLRGTCPVANCDGKIGIWGSFVNTVSPDGLEYSTDGPSIGTIVKLTD